MAEAVDVLVLSSDLDFATDLVCRELGLRGSPFLRLNRESLPALGLTLDPVTPTLRCRFEGRSWIVDSSLRSVWWRVGTFDREISDRSLDLQTQLQRTQWSAFLRSMMVFTGARWINHPAATYAAETKALQLRIAREVGFDIPETVMSNDPVGFADREPGTRVAFKSIDTLLLREGDAQLFGYTTLLDIKHVAVEDLRLSPATIQVPLEPKLDLRVTVVGETIWCAEVRGVGERIEGDWRLTPKHELTYPEHILPREIEQCCRALVARLGLVFGAIDLALVDGCYWFIEINPTGEWGWLERPDRSIAAAIAGELACRSIAA
ncbi:RimK-like protein [Mesorhizobium sp. CA6]|uniref:RimK-like protein n=1 Tax=Mesorhizobium sp. CA6 TaxID=588500 RepID=UPI001CCEBEDE|nr:RimK-like protein [Mesorhizobium sp. CA6]MBZ9766714.1 RimK-like protein [Mesorhizobium sp. CA6]